MRWRHNETIWKNSIIVLCFRYRQVIDFVSDMVYYKIKKRMILSRMIIHQQHQPKRNLNEH